MIDEGMLWTEEEFIRVQFTQKTTDAELTSFVGGGKDRVVVASSEVGEECLSFA